MEAAPTKEAAQECRPEKGSAAAGAFPIRQPRSKKEINDESESEDKPGNEKQDFHFHHREKEERKYDKS